METLWFLQLLFSRAYESDFHFHWGYKGFYDSDSMAREIQP